jgi:hypothetical protein
VVRTGRTTHTHTHTHTTSGIVSKNGLRALGFSRRCFSLPFNFPLKTLTYDLTGIFTYFPSWEVKVGSLDVLAPYFRFTKWQSSSLVSSTPKLMQ